MDPHARFIQSLTREEEHLLVIREILYDGDWKEVIADLRARKEGKPVVFKLNSRIGEDLRRIEKLCDYETMHGVDLGVYLVQSGKYPELVAVLGELERETEPQSDPVSFEQDRASGAKNSGSSTAPLPGAD